ncbi:3-hydroxyacyl-[acyl-carrier-protein] dehydratase FabZ-like isoform X2 [Salvia hispanica]|uniref:3-hydroxyacyl-[acyl-carrier-protein] dehydratase FabZ-like isoform X2 n=1 Tax=Salvia hispanica TaxID=49212 RepID=UPI0020093C21|nr:3-hydroxyacyl-[acyl-carrier-protein] dehydratase FabZ-like isoform X2 [Salvia hispanica]
MASSVLSHSLFSTLTSPHSPPPENAPPPLSVSVKQPFATSRSHAVAANFNKIRSLTASCAASDDHASSAELPIELKYPAFPTVMDINQIRDILPHRFPFLLVDRVIEFTPGVSAVAIKNVTINDNFFPGHFPERPIMPGVLMIEAMAQVGGLIMLQPEEGGWSGSSFFFAGIDKVRFRKPVIAGDTLVMRMNLVKLQKRFGIAKLEGKAYVGGEVVCEGEFLMVGN